MAKTFAKNVQLELHRLAGAQHSDMAGGVPLSQPVIFALHTARRGWQLFPNTEPMFDRQNEGSEDVQKAGGDSTIQSSKVSPTLSAYFTSNSTRGHRQTFSKNL